MRLVLLPVLCLGACTSLNTRLPEISNDALKAEQAKQEKIAFAEINRLRDRLDKVAHKVLSANADLCSRTGPDIGVKTQTAKSFPKELRQGAIRELGLGDEPVIVYVRPGSSGDKAGLRTGGYIYDETEALGAPSRKLAAHLTEGRPLYYREGTSKNPIEMEYETVCDYKVVLKMSPAINALANGKAIVMNAGMMNFVESDDELAYIIGHELAHNTQSHIRKAVTNYILSLGGTRYTRKFESEADYVGIYYMERAGFNSDGVEKIWQRLAKQSLRPIARAKTHPVFPSRTLQITATREEIAAKRARNLPLTPELRE